MRASSRPDECGHPANGLLPWFVRGTLQGTELEWVRDHVDSCEICTYECDSLADTVIENDRRAREAPVVARPRPDRRWLLPWAVCGLLVVTAALGGYGLWRSSPSDGVPAAAALAPTMYLDLGAGPTRAADPLKSVSMPEGVLTLVVSFFVPVSDRSIYTFDLEGPGGSVLVRQEPIRELDEMGRCTFAVPRSLLGAPGWYTIVVRVATPDEDSRLYPYPFELKPLDRSPALPGS